MMKSIAISIDVDSALYAHVLDCTGRDKAYADAEEYITELIRRDLERDEEERFQTLKAELQRAFATPDDQYVTVTADDVIARNRRRADA